MPADFERCVDAGGKVITKSLGNGKYIHICYLHGQAYHGELKRRKKHKREKFQQAMKKLYGKGD
jgi:hypothetical protein